MKICSIDDCCKPAPTDKYCRMHRKRLYTTGRLDLKPKPSPIERLMAKVEPVTESGCWIWTGHTYGIGYGSIVIDGTRVPAHRAAYTEFVGEIPEGMLVCHRCDVPACCNPDHLFLGTYKDNMRDCVTKGRFKAAEHASKAREARIRLNPEAVKVIKYASEYMDISVKRLAELHGVNIDLIYKIRRGEAWANVTI